MEQAGDARDLSRIAEGTPPLLQRLDMFSEAFARLEAGEKKPEPQDAPPQESIDRETLIEAWQALTDFVAQMDYEDSSFILTELKGYALPPEEEARAMVAEEALERLDWEELGNVAQEVLAALTGEKT